MVAALMDEQSLAEPPPMDRDEAFDAAKQVGFCVSCNVLSLRNLVRSKWCGRLTH